MIVYFVDNSLKINVLFNHNNYINNIVFNIFNIVNNLKLICLTHDTCL